jgi:hypothetical protein
MIGMLIPQMSATPISDASETSVARASRAGRSAIDVEVSLKGMSQDV